MRHGLHHGLGFAVRHGDVHDQARLAFGLKLRKTPQAEIDKRVRDAAKILQIEHLLGRKPKELSGGQRQRVAMGRAIVRSPQVFLMDEPLSNLDAKLRVQTRTQIASLQRRLGVTTVYVTHDQTEAMTMGDRVAVLKDGLLQQVDTPRRMYDHPDNLFVAGFIGSPAMNLIGMPVTDGGVKFGSKVIPVPRDALGNAGGEVVVGVRPEDVDVRTEGDGLPVVIEVVEELGADAYVYGTPQTGHVAKEEGLAKPFIARVDGRRPPEKGQTLYITPQESRVHLFHPETGARLMD